MSVDGFPPARELSADGERLVIRRKLNPYLFFRIIILQALGIPLGLVVLEIGFLAPGEPVSTIWIGLAIIASTFLNWFYYLGFRSLVLDEDGLKKRWFWRTKRVFWADVDSISVMPNGRLSGVNITLKKTGVLGLHRHLIVQDFFEIRKSELAAIISKFFAMKNERQLLPHK